MTNLQETQRLANEIASQPNKKNFKYKKDPRKIMVIHANPEAIEVRCPNCSKIFYKQNGLQIVFFCSKSCRKSYREVPNKFIVEDRK